MLNSDYLRPVKSIMTTRNRLLHRLSPLFVALFAFVAVDAMAQHTNPFGQRGAETLPAEDFEMLKSELGGLLDSGNSGQVAAWSSEVTGNYGTLELEFSFERNALHCHRVTHVIKFSKESDPRRFTFSYCRDPSDDRWKILE